jgi:hypothetical protein
MRPFERVHSFEQDRHRWAVCSDDSESDGELPADDASNELLDFLATLKLQGELSAKDVCIIAHLGAAAGLTGPAAKLAYNPKAPSGHFNRHFKKVLKLDTEVDGQDSCYDTT